MVCNDCVLKKSQGILEQVYFFINQKHAPMQNESELFTLGNAFFKRVHDVYFICSMQHLTLPIWIQ